MKKRIYIVLISALCFGCSSSEQINGVDNKETPSPNTSENPENQEEHSNVPTYKILALGDSYTIGQSVCNSCKFPEQLKDSLISKLNSDNTFELKVIATTGWTTSDLIKAIHIEKPSNDYSLVTLLIGVNNQYQNKPFSIYQTEFPNLVNKAIFHAKGEKQNLIVISIPDYAFTPFGRGNQDISNDIDKYNTFAKTYCEDNNITYVHITDITRMGLENPDLVASDGLHPSELAYSKIVERLLPLAIEKLKN